MDPVTSLALGEATSRLVSVVKEKVIGRWTKARSAKFFEAFLQEVELEQLGGRSGQTRLKGYWNISSKMKAVLR